MNVLWLHHRKGWAIHNTGLTWWDRNMDLIHYQDIDEDFLNEYSDEYDYIFHFRKSLLSLPRTNKDVIVLYDPIEITDGQGNPKEDILEEIPKCRKCIVISKELQQMMKDLTGITYPVVSTFSHLLPNPPTDNTCSFISLCSPMKRKNPELREKLEQFAIKQNWEFFSKVGYKTVSDIEYQKLYQKYPVYICTSFREGGPLPPMDSMSQGGVVLSTRVGQMLEIIKDGETGFFCDTEKDFRDKMLLLKHDKDLFMNMRWASYNHYLKVRNKSRVQQDLMLALR